MKIWRVFFCALFLAAAALALSGCATDNNPENVSSLPWNAPQNWEGPLPSSINQGR
ncbi:MAG TPA: hypothetical protein VHB20_01285 [Verrucomicrobiae bacterium]|jgi:uncharacterized lipoprotein YmbA|nr:hypothetical protein [Verrucomicrobiae bacterium]